MRPGVSLNVSPTSGVPLYRQLIEQVRTPVAGARLTGGEFLPPVRTVAAGSVVGLLGQNAAGKTTLINAALGLIRPTFGQATIFGEPSWDLSPQTKANLGYVPQVITLYPWMRVRHLCNYTASFYPR